MNEMISPRDYSDSDRALLDEVVGLLPAGDFLYKPSVILDSVQAMGTARMREVISRNSVIFRMDDFNESICETELLADIDRSVMVCDGKNLARYLLVRNRDEGMELHGRRVKCEMDEVYYADYGMLLAEIIVWICQRILFIRMTYGEDLFDRYARTLFSIYTSKAPKQYCQSEFSRSFGLSSHRFDDFSIMICVYGQLEGLFREPLGEGRLLLGQVGKSKWMLEHEEHSPVKPMFEWVEYERNMTHAQVERFDSAIQELCSKGILRRLRPTHIRLRRSGDTDFIGRYYDDLHLILVDPNHMGCFVHEYGHSLDHRGFYSNKKDFDPLYTRYRLLISFTDFFKNCNKKSYYLRRSEAFARMFERYVFLREGVGPLNSVSSDSVHPDNSDLDRLIKEYFDRIYQFPGV